VYNFPGWVVILGLGSAAMLLSRWWFERSGRRTWVALVAPFATVLGALVVLVSPLSQLVLWLGPVFHKGGVTEWVMLGVHFAFPLLLLAVLWRGRMVAGLSLREDWPALVFPSLFHFMDVGFAVGGGFPQLLPLQLGITAMHLGLIGLVWRAGRTLPARARQGGDGVGDRAPNGLLQARTDAT
jgi:hypothetical protein